MAERIDDTGFGGIRLIQETTHFCYGIDAVLLADFAARRRHRRIIDLGTNNAVIPLILSELTAAEEICGVEVQSEAFAIAQRNVELNGLGGRLHMVNSDILDVREHFAAGSYDAVVCNPPYSAQDAAIRNASDALHVARHETTASLEDFIKSAAYLLKDMGMFYLVHRPSRIIDISCICREYRLEPKFIRFVSPKCGEKPNIMLVECRKNAGRELKMLDPLFVYDNDGSYSEEIMRIYRRI